MSRAVLFLAVGLAGAWAHATPAYVLRDGTRLEASAVARREDCLVVVLSTEGDSRVEQLHLLEDIVGLDWPEPDALREARTALERGDTERALAALEAVLTEFSAFPTTPGSWWATAGLLRARALVGAQRPAEAAAGLQSLLGHQPPPDVAAAARLLFVEIDLQAGRVDLAAAMLAQVEGSAVLAAAEQAQVALLRGEICLRRGAVEAALEAFLAVPAFFGRERSVQPAALDGAARAYAQWGQHARSARAHRALLDGWPSHPLAAAARAALAAEQEVLP